MQMTTEMTQQWLNAFTKAIEENKGYGSRRRSLSRSICKTTA